MDYQQSLYITEVSQPNRIWLLKIHYHSIERVKSETVESKPVGVHKYQQSQNNHIDSGV